MSLDDGATGRRRSDEGKAIRYAGPAPVEYVCIDKKHLRIGRSVPDGRGHLTVNEGRWAYCSAGLADEPHVWKASGGLQFAAIRHADLGQFEGG